MDIIPPVSDSSETPDLYPLWSGECPLCGQHVHFSGSWESKGFPPPFVICALDRIPVEVRRVPAS